VSGNGSAQVYLRPGLRRRRRLLLGEIEAGDVSDVPRSLVSYLASLPGIALVAGAGPAAGTIDLVSASGRAHLARSNGYIRYRPDTADVLRLGGAAERTDRDWLAATVDTAFPDGPTQLLQVFRSARAGDLVVVADRGTDLRSDWEIPEHRSGHGSLIAEHMRCLVVANRPFAPESVTRTVDLFPAVLDHLGIAIPDAIDGVRPDPAGVLA
jgi:hypothetical protein